MSEANVYLWHVAGDPSRIILGHKYWTKPPLDPAREEAFGAIAMIHQDDWYDTFGWTPDLTDTPQPFNVTVAPVLTAKESQ